MRGIYDRLTCKKESLYLQDATHLVTLNATGHRYLLCLDRMCIFGQICGGRSTRYLPSAGFHNSAATAAKRWPMLISVLLAAEGLGSIPSRQG